MLFRITTAALLFLSLLSVPAHAEKNLQRPPGTTRYAAMVRQLTSLLDYDKTHGNRMALTSLGKSVKGRDLWMVTLHNPGEGTHPADKSATLPEREGEEGVGMLPAAPTVLAASSGTSPLPPVPGGPQRSGEVGSLPAPKKIFYLCRQHGHEPASTEGALAFITGLVKADDATPMAQSLDNVTVYVVPMANPDGAEAFLRHNAHDVDINRDWLRRTQPETRALYAAIQRLHPDLVTDQHELYPNDTRPDFTETAGQGSGAPPGVIAACGDTQNAVQGAMIAEGFLTFSNWITDTHPARLAHRFGCIVASIPTILFETQRLTGTGRTVAARAVAHEEFMRTILRDQAGEHDQLLAEASAWQAAHAWETQRLASRHKLIPRPTGKPIAAAPETTEAQPEKGSE